jgi:hypothetical protein
MLTFQRKEVYQINDINVNKELEFICKLNRARSKTIIVDAH